MDEHFYSPLPICTWDDLARAYEARFNDPKKRWIFRGQLYAASDVWDFQTSLERAALRFGRQRPDGDPQGAATQRALDRDLLRDGIPGANGKRMSLPRYEGGLLRQFKRQGHQYISETPQAGDYIEWFALMRHYEAPTRLLDWTYSLFVAVYFALEESEEEFVVWAFNTEMAGEPVGDILETLQHDDANAFAGWHRDPDITRPETFRDLFIRSRPLTFVAPVNPYRLNERLVRQQGIFLCPGDVSKPFEDNFSAVLEKCARPGEDLLRLTFKNVDKRDFLTRLMRMNINRATLFPGLGGFAHSLKMSAAFPDILVPDDDWPAGEG